MNVYTQIPEYIKDSDVFKEKMEHLPNQERSEKRIIKNINETLNLLKESGTTEAMKQRKIITSAIYDTKFGYPNIDETRTVTRRYLFEKKTS